VFVYPCPSVASREVWDSHSGLGGQDEKQVDLAGVGRSRRFLNGSERTVQLQHCRNVETCVRRLHD
jgi:hypothetical protein